MARPSPSGGLRPPTYDFDGEGVLAAAAADRAMEDGAAIPPRPHPVTNTSSPSAWPCPGTGGDTATLPASPLVPRASAFAKPEEPADKLPKRATGLGRARAWPLGTAGVRPQVRLWHRPESAPHPESPGSSLLTEPKVSRLLTQWRELRLSHGRLRARVVSTGGGPPNPLRTMAAGGCSRRRGQRARGVEAATAPPWHCRVCERHRELRTPTNGVAGGTRAPSQQGRPGRTREDRPPGNAALSALKSGAHVHKQWLVCPERRASNSPRVAGRLGPCRRARGSHLPT